MEPGPLVSAGAGPPAGAPARYTATVGSAMSTAPAASRLLSVGELVLAPVGDDAR